MGTRQTAVNAIVDTAHHLLEMRGYNAWSYADIATVVGVRTASIHYHFPSKADLVHHIVARYRTTMRVLLAQIDRELTDPRQKLARYAGATGSDGGGIPRLGLCAVLAAEAPTLPDAVLAEVDAFCTEQALWLQRVFAEGLATGVLRVHQSAAIEAHLFLATLEGAVLIARAHNDPALYTRLAQHVVATNAVSTT